MGGLDEHGRKPRLGGRSGNSDLTHDDDLRRAWLEVLERPRRNARVLVNAASFFAIVDHDRSASQACSATPESGSGGTPEFGANLRY